MSEYTLDASVWSEPFRHEPLPYVGEPPCVGCEHAQRCAHESLACCAFAAYLQRTDIRRRSDHREPSAAWFHYAENMERVGLVPPACAQCKQPRRVRANNNQAAPGVTQAKIVALLDEHPGLLQRDMSQRLGITEKAVRGALRTMLRHGMVEVCGVQLTARKAQMKQYALRGDSSLDSIVELLEERPNLRAREVGDVLGLTWQEALGRLEMLLTLGRVDYGWRRGVRVWRVRHGANRT